MAKGEIARNEQFLLFQQCFQKACSPGMSKGVIVWEWVNQGTADMESSEACLLAIIVGIGYLLFKIACCCRNCMAWI